MIDFLLNYYREHNPVHYCFLKESEKELESIPRIKACLEFYLMNLQEGGITEEEMIQCYDLIIKMQFQEELYFRRNKKYRYSTLEETKTRVYGNNEYMKRYMIGLGISNMLWQVHWKLLDFFCKQLEAMSAADQYLEIGMGHGLQFAEAVKSGKFNTYNGVDIAPASVLLTEQLMRNLKVKADYQLSCMDFFEMEPKNQYDFIVFGELLEHIDRPELFLNKLKAMLKADGTAYLSTCTNSPAIDHVYLFRNVQEIRDLLNDCGFGIVEELVVREGKAEEMSAPASYAAVISCLSSYDGG